MTTTFNTTVTFTCSAGYRNHGGDDTITCQANGQWSSTSLDCQAVVCRIPAARNNTEPSVQMTTTFNTTVTFTCSPGYRNHGGDDTITCQANGQWSSTSLDCQAVDCGIPAARNNTEPSVQMTTTFNTTVTFTCSPGYRNHGGDDTITCQANGQWSSTSLDCQAEDCRIPAARNNTEPSVQMTTTFNTTVTFTCSAGYRNHGGDDTITCQANGQWSSTSLDCQAVDCGIPAARNNTEPSVQMTTTFNTTVTFTCSPGYRNHGGDDTITCQANGQWSSTSLDCQAEDCRIPAARNNTEPSVQMTTTFNTTVTFTCSAGYRNHGGDDTITCQANGQWSSTSLDCQAVDCRIPAARNNTEPSVQMTTTFNTTVTFTCSPGYRNHGGDDTITCQANGQWSSTSLDCQAVDCGIPVARNNTEPSVQMTTTFNTTVTFTCSAGYRNHGGDDTITCQANGQWSSTSLDCRVIPNWITTKTLSAGPAKLTCTDRMSPAGSLVSVSCEADEMLIGCSSKSASSSGKVNGVKIVMVKGTPFCQIDITSTTGASAQYASARCCKQDGLQCEYLTDGPSKNINDAHVQSECFKSFQVMGCGVHQPNGYLDGVEINPSYCRAYAGGFSVTGVYSYATCCRAPDLSCSVHSAKPQPVSGLLKATCPDGFTLTGCGGYSPWKEARGSYIADDGGIPTCHVESETDRPGRTTVFYKR
ncbi:sushi, von Willebrand factor type A, EGF and pentraxin domain-containing protein 1-like isoform X2 [Haliotis rufescens]|uniref:sushi, von Willebrand factor type A, EGF and pentraxin domain-containing protein 1-like isoform X2 n=1 Tax=Haliotis rufescens TaxID=6454 RepID=UPI00201F77A5|nr:sushi, von Willebrand factor type A, EGF and pentraxin domain-containing protein 1-like isoform X2 [Haliotis rufescens]